MTSSKATSNSSREFPSRSSLPTHPTQDSHITTSSNATSNSSRDHLPRSSFSTNPAQDSHHMTSSNATSTSSRDRLPRSSSSPHPNQYSNLTTPANANSNSSRDSLPRYSSLTYRNSGIDSFSRGQQGFSMPSRSHNSSPPPLGYPFRHSNYRHHNAYSPHRRYTSSRQSAIFSLPRYPSDQFQGNPPPLVTYHRVTTSTTPTRQASSHPTNFLATTCTNALTQL